MNIEDQVCSLELAKRLKALNFKQEGYFYWINEYLDNWKLFHAENDNCDQHNAPGDITWLKIQKDKDKAYSAFTVAELLNLLPHRITTKENEPYNSYRLRMEKGLWVKSEDANNASKLNATNFYSVNYYCDSTSQELDWMFASLTKNMTDENGANACAKMLIYLLEEGLIKND
jgi:hypothetical protein